MASKRIAHGVSSLVGLAIVLFVAVSRRMLPDGDPNDDPPSNCFPGDATVQLSGGSSKAMRELELGDKVAVWDKATGRVVYDDVYAFGHNDGDAVSEFVRIVVQAAEYSHPASSILELTSHHFVPTLQQPGGVTTVVYRRAKDISVGDVVWATNATGTAAHIVKEISSSFKEGLFNPLTMSGTVVVDGVVASVHSDWFLDPLFDLLGMVHYLPAAYQVVLSPVRLLYTVLSKEMYMATYNALDARLNLAEFGSRHGGQVVSTSAATVFIFAALALSATKKRLASPTST